jgi:ABC-2 type transport system permease protein
VTATGALVRLILRRDRIRLAVWVLATLGLVWFSAAAVTSIYNTPEARAGYAATVTSSPATVLLTGPAIAVDQPGGIMVLETGITSFIAITLFAMFMTVRHTRAEEEDGRLELLRATVMGRYAQLVSAVSVVSVGCVVIGAGITLTFLGQGLDPVGSLLFGVSVTLTGLCVTAASACFAQLTEHARGALALTGLVAGVAYVLRGLGDVQALNDAVQAADGAPVTTVPEVGLLSWLSPYGWAQATHPFGGDRWWPLLLLVALTAVLGLLTLRLNARRDLGAGLIPARPGPAEASARLNGPLPLAVRLQRASFIGWACGLVALGALYGSIASSVDNLMEANRGFADLLEGEGGTIIDAFFQVTLLINVLVASVFTLTSMLRLRGDETRGRAESILATRTSRFRWAGGTLTVSAVGSGVLLLLIGLATGLAGAKATGDSEWIGTLTLAAVLYLPACLVVSGFAVLLIGWFPRAAQAAWALVAQAFLVGWLGPLLKTPRWLNDLSPFTHVPTLPLDDASPLPLVVLTLVAALLIVVGLIGLRRRDITT